MANSKLYYGNILRCTIHMYENISKTDIKQLSDTTYLGEPQSELEKQGTVLIKVDKDKYFDVKNTKNLFKILLSSDKKATLDSLIIGTYPEYKDCLYVDEDTLIPYKNYKKDTPKTYQKVKK